MSAEKNLEREIRRRTAINKRNQETAEEGSFLRRSLGRLLDWSQDNSMEAPPEKKNDDDAASGLSITGPWESKDRRNLQEGGALLVPPEQEAIPTDTYTPEDQANAEATQVPDEQMESEFVDFVLDEALNDDEQTYLMGALEADSRLSTIFDKVVETASEFTGDGPVEGPGTGVSDSIPARLSDGEFVITKKATDQIGADNLQSIMDEAERAFDGGLQNRYAFGGLARDDEKSLLEDDEEEIKKQMINANRMPSVIS